MASSNEYINRYLVDCGGVNNTLPDELIADNELSDARNIVPGTSGQQHLIKRLGYTAYRAGVANMTVSGIYSGHQNRYYSTYYTGTAKDFIIYTLADGTERYSHTDQDTKASWSTFNSADYFVGDFHQLKTTDGLTWADWSAVGSGIDVIESYNNFMFGIDTTNTTLYWSAIGNPDSWPAANNLVLSSNNETDYSTALVCHGDVLVYFTYQSMRHIYGTEELGMRVSYSNRDVGCIAGHAAVSTPFGLVWWAPYKGIVISRDGYKIETPMLNKLRKTLVSTITYGQQYIHCNYNGYSNVVHFYVPTTAGNICDLRIDYYPATDAFYLQDLKVGFPTVSVKASATAKTFSGAETEYIGHGIGVYTPSGTTSQDNSQTFTAYMETKRQAAATAISYKVDRNVLLTTKMTTGGTVSLQIYRDNATSAETAISITTGVGVNDYLVGINAQHHKIKYKISDSLNERTEYYSLVEAGRITEVM